MKQIKAKQILAAALSAAMVFTGIPAIAETETVYAVDGEEEEPDDPDNPEDPDPSSDEDAGEDDSPTETDAKETTAERDITATGTLSEDHKHTVNCYNNATYYTAEQSKSLVGLQGATDSNYNAYIIKSGMYDDSGIYVPVSIQILGSKTSTGGVEITNDNKDQYYERSTSSSDRYIKGAGTVGTHYNVSKLTYYRKATDSDLVDKHDELNASDMVYDTIQEVVSGSSVKTTYTRAVSGDAITDGKITTLATIPESVVNGLYEGIELGDNFLPDSIVADTPGELAQINHTITLKSLTASDVTASDSTSVSVDVKVESCMQDEETEEISWEETKASNSISADDEDTDGDIYRITLSAPTYADYVFYIYVDLTAPELTGSNIVLDGEIEATYPAASESDDKSDDTSTDSSDSKQDDTADKTAEEDSEKDADDSSSTQIVSNLVKGSMRVSKIDIDEDTDLYDDLYKLEATMLDHRDTSGAHTPDSLASASIRWTELTADETGAYDVSSLCAKEDGVYQFVFKASDFAGNVSYYASDLYYCYQEAGLTDTDVEVPLTSEIKDFTKDSEYYNDVVLPYNNLKAITAEGTEGTDTTGTQTVTIKCYTSEDAKDATATASAIVTYGGIIVSGSSIERSGGSLILSGAALTTLLGSTETNGSVWIELDDTTVSAASTAISAWNNISGLSADQKKKCTLSNSRVKLTRKDLVKIVGTSDITVTLPETSELIQVSGNTTSGSDESGAGDAAKNEPKVYVGFNGADNSFASQATHKMYDGTTYTLDYSLVAADGYLSYYPETINSITSLPKDRVTSVSKAGKYYILAQLRTDTELSKVVNLGTLWIEPTVQVTMTSQSDENDVVTAAAVRTSSSSSTQSKAGMQISPTLKANTKYTVSIPGYTVSGQAISSTEKENNFEGSNVIEIKAGETVHTYYLIAADSGYIYNLVVNGTIAGSKSDEKKNNYDGGLYGGDTAADGSASKDGSTTGTDSQGNQVTKNTQTKEDGTVEETTDFKVSENVSAKVTVDTKDGETKSEAVITDTTEKASSLTLSAQTVKSITEASGQANTTITYQTTDLSVKVDASLLTPGKTLKVINQSGKKTQLVASKTVTVNESGDTTLDLNGLNGSSYQLVDKATEKAIGNEILGDINVKNVKGTSGKKSAVKITKGGYKNSIEKITYKSTNKKVATVDKNGKVTLKKAGKAKIKVTVKLVNGQKKTYTSNVKSTKAKVKVKVKKSK